MPPVTKNLLIINILVFLATYGLQFSGVDLTQWFGLHFCLSSDFRIYQLLTYMFMHATIEHIFFNMFALWMFGRVMEQVLGSKRFLLFYLTCGIGAGVLQEVAQFGELLCAMKGIINYAALGPTVGASGAIYGILLGFGYTFPDQKLFIIPIPVPIKAKWFVTGYVVIELLSLVLRSQDGVAHMAHLGGMLFAWLLLRHWTKPSARSNKFNIRDSKFWNVFRQKTKKHDSYNKSERSGDRFTSEMDYNAQRKQRQEEIDRILMKVRQHGYGSLTEEEKRKLFDASNE